MKHFIGRVTMMKYWKGWLKAFAIGFEINPKLFRVVLMWLCIWIKPKEFSFSLSFPKYALIVTNADRYFYKHSDYRFAKVKMLGKTNFYVMHVVGNVPTEIEGKNGEWDSE